MIGNRKENVKTLNGAYKLNEPIDLTFQMTLFEIQSRKVMDVFVFD
jgi:hypothetical protein